jgi:hypothetical protein
MHRIFLLSPAHTGGLRAAMLMRPEAEFDLARRLRAGSVTLGEAFVFCSGLYFRGKLAYASHFARAPARVAGVQVITAGSGLVPAERPLSVEELQRFATVPVEADEERFSAPLVRAARKLAAMKDCEFVLLGSVATGKYVDVLLPVLGERLLFPAQFVGRGDMSRGGLMLRCVAAGQELECIPVAGAVRRGSRPAKLPAPARRSGGG